ncbi:MAG: AAA family ATPase [Rikenellaceae bacterium]|nr:AAA family ATPase [Rikenellaceae bacterium]
MIVFLIGFMGCGKTSIGRKVAAQASFRFVDMDREIEERCGMKVADIFQRHGEESFRRCEREFLENLAASEGDTIVSTGGGAPCHGENMELMNRLGRTVYLKMSPPKLVKRLEHGREKRPKIQGMDDERLLEYIFHTLPGREEYYGKAHFIIDCDGATDDYICRHIAGYLETE